MAPSTAPIANEQPTPQKPQVLEASRWAPSASNIQPWIFFIGLKGDPAYNKIFETLVEFNQLWAVNAPVLILSCGKITTGDNETPNGIWQYDVGQSVAYMTLQAMEDELYVHQMTGFDALKAAELFSLHEDIRAVSVVAVGSLGDPAMLHPRMQKSELAERERKGMDTFVFSEKYGTASDIVEI